MSESLHFVAAGCLLGRAPLATLMVRRAHHKWFGLRCPEPVCEGSHVRARVDNVLSRVDYCLFQNYALLHIRESTCNDRVEIDPRANPFRIPKE